VPDQRNREIPDAPQASSKRRRLTVGFGLACVRAETVKGFRVGILGGENTQDRLARYDEFQRLLECHLTMPVKLHPAPD
jgi:ABC-type phosphate/phosphonate transport system substrate-binding protein